MKVNYFKSIFEKIMDAKIEALKLGKKIENIELTESEWNDLIGIIEKSNWYNRCSSVTGSILRMVSIGKEDKILSPFHIISISNTVIHDYCYLDGILVYKETK